MLLILNILLSLNNIIKYFQVNEIIIKNTVFILGNYFLAGATVMTRLWFIVNNATVVSIHPHKTIKQLKRMKDEFKRLDDYSNLSMNYLKGGIKLRKLSSINVVVE